jgi:hypothetical protein
VDDRYIVALIMKRRDFHQVSARKEEEEEKLLARIPKSNQSEMWFRAIDGKSFLCSPREHTHIVWPNAGFHDM